MKRIFIDSSVLFSADQKHLLGKPELSHYAGVQIVTPKEAVAILRSIN